jgi:D-alanyl-lipoteichoic acid acyltransferase DltB (MBOAT superfamily)
MAFNYRVGILLGRQYQLEQQYPGNRFTSKSLLGLGITINLIVLGYYKYANFLANSVNSLIGTDFSLETIVLPLAISFFTFQKIAYLVDSYCGKTQNYKFLDYCLFVIFFPQLIAGPIVHHWEIFPQLAKKNITKFSSANFALGITIFSLGLFKKVIIADGVATYATPLFNAAEAGEVLDLLEAWYGALAYTFQLYFDFSGYSDMAIGIARMFGILLPLNFNSPYKANSIIDFWQRWHITLSRFLKEYLYIPLGGNRKGELRRYINLMITMLLGGLWHGASWTFVIWGGLHGVYLTINHLWNSVNKTLGLQFKRISILNTIVSRTITFLAVVVAWAFFRAESLDGAISILKSMAGLNGISVPSSLASKLGRLQPYLMSLGFKFNDGSSFSLISSYEITAFWLTVLLFIVWFMPNTQQILSEYKPALMNTNKFNKVNSHILLWKPTLAWAISLGLISFIAISKVLEAQTSEFLYFQF